MKNQILEDDVLKALIKKIFEEDENLLKRLAKTQN